MMCLKHFFQGALGRRVDYSTRQYSRCYKVGFTVGAIVFFSLPVAIVFGLGVIVGALIW